MDDDVRRTLLDVEFRSLLGRRLDCVRAPLRCDPSQFALEGSEYHDEVSRLVAGRRRDGIVATAGDLEIRSLSFDSLTETSARAEVCLVDSVVLVDVSGDVDVILDDSIRGEVSMWTMHATEQGWRIGSKEVEEWSMDETVCEV